MTACAACSAELPPTARFCPSCGRAAIDLPATEETVRRTVTVVFCDLTGSTALGESHDPELMRSVVTRYFAAVSEVMLQHGGTVEKFIGDAVMTVFGVPETHEDDALRAVRAADGARAAVERMNDELQQVHGLRLSVRLGVETGEVVVGDGTRGTVATGDAVNVAARLEQAAAPGEVLVGPVAWRLVRDLATGDLLEPVLLRGKAASVPAWRLTAVDDETKSTRRMAGTRLVGRDREIALLRQTMDRCTAERSCHLVTLLGVPGVGKTRLVNSLLQGLPADVTVLRGRCLPYGDAVGLWPVREILRAAAHVPGTVDEQDAGRFAAVLGEDSDSREIVDTLAPLAGLAGALPSQEQSAWAVRRLLEALGRTGPVVMVVDDLHWASQVMFDLVDHLADWVRDASLLLVCIGRPELFDDRPTWAGGRVNATSLLLSPLAADDATELVRAIAGDAALAPQVAARVQEAAAGVPLCAEHLFAMLVEDERIALVDGTWVWSGDESTLDAPPSIAAILATRLERLDPAGRTVLEAASVVGEVFYPGAVIEIVDTLTGAEVRSALGRLVRRQLVRPDTSDIAGEDALQFVHGLVQDVAYGAMSKSRRADLHVRLAVWLAKRAPVTPGVDAFVGHHLAAAVALRDALGPRDSATRELAVEAVAVLEAAARRVEPSDWEGASGLLERAARTTDEPREEARLQLRRSLLAMLHEDMVTRAAAWVSARAAADRSADGRLQDLVAVQGSSLAVHLPHLGAEVASDAALASWRRRFREEGDDEALAETLLALVVRNTELARWGDTLTLLDELDSVASRLGDVPLTTFARLIAIAACIWGPEPAGEALERIDQLMIDPALQLREIQVDLVGQRSTFLAMLDRPEEAWQQVDRFYREAEELHRDVAGRWMGEGYTRRLLGDLAGAEAAFRHGVELLDRQREVAYLSTMLPMLGEVRLALGDEVEARSCAERARDLSPADDIESQSRWRSLMARLDSRSGRHDDAVRHAQEGVAWGSRGDQLDSMGDRHVALAEVLEAAGRPGDARAAAAAALDFYLRKGNIPSQRHAQALMQRL